MCYAKSHVGITSRSYPFYLFLLSRFHLQFHCVSRVPFVTLGSNQRKCTFLLRVSLPDSQKTFRINVSYSACQMNTASRINDLSAESLGKERQSHYVKNWRAHNILESAEPNSLKTRSLFFFILHFLFVPFLFGFREKEHILRG